MAEPKAPSIPEPNALVPLAEDLIARRGALLAAFEEMSAAELAETYLGATGEILALFAKAREHQEVLRLIERVYATRLFARKATQLPSGHKQLAIRLESGKRLEPLRNNALLRDELLQLEIDGERLAREVIDKVVYFEDPKPPELKSDLNELNKLQKIHGQPIADIREKCIEDRAAQPKLIVEVLSATD